jgi:hypothetical protein
MVLALHRSSFSKPRASSSLVVLALVSCSTHLLVASTLEAGGVINNNNSDVPVLVQAPPKIYSNPQGPTDGDENVTIRNHQQHQHQHQQEDVANSSASLEDPWFLSKDASSHIGDWDNFWNELECDDIFSIKEARPIHDQSTWVLLRGIYQGIVGPNYSTLDETRMFGNGFKVPVEVQQIPGKGRGVIALEDIPEGTVIWDSSLTARFPSPVYFRRYLAALPQELACDVLIWAYAEDYDYEEEGDADVPPFRGNRPILAVDLNEGTFVNSIDSVTKKNLDGETSTTTRRIKAGEEIIVDYADFERGGSWNAAGFGFEGEGVGEVPVVY